MFLWGLSLEEILEISSDCLAEGKGLCGVRNDFGEFRWTPEFQGIYKIAFSFCKLMTCRCGSDYMFSWVLRLCVVIGKNIDGSTVEVCLAKPVEKGNLVRWTRSPANGKLSPAVSCSFIWTRKWVPNHYQRCSCYYQTFHSLRLCHFSTDHNETFHTC